jgi:hypothetical protein
MGPGSIRLEALQAAQGLGQPHGVTGTVGLQPLLQHLGLVLAWSGWLGRNGMFKQPIEIREQQTTAHGLDERNQGLPALGLRGMLQQGTP